MRQRGQEEGHAICEAPYRDQNVSGADVLRMGNDFRSELAAKRSMACADVGN